MTKIALISRHHEVDDIYTHVFENNGINWTAGQYMAFVLPDVSSILEQYEHWFSISSAPSEGTINITVRARQSPFKQALMALQPGQLIDTHTVDGDFYWPDDGKEPLFIAGGIGITPFISMIRQRLFENGEMKATLVYFNRPGSGVAFADELKAVAQNNPEFTLVFLEDKPLTASIVEPFIHQPANKIVFLAGPVPMVDRIGSQLELNGMEVKRDWYFGYDIRNF